MDPLFLKVVDGQPIDNPVYESNLIEVYGTVPPEFQPFTRVAQNITPTIYQKADDEYGNVNGQWQDVWVAIEQTAEEKAVTTIEINANGVRQQQDFISYANSRIAGLISVGNTQGAEVWQTYLANLNAWVMPPINPEWTQATIDYQFPTVPVKITNLNLGSGTGTFANIEQVYQSPDGTIENSTCQATTQNFNGWTPSTVLPVTNIDYIDSDFIANELIYGQTSKAAYVYLSSGDFYWVIPT